MKPILPLLLSALITVAYFQSTAQTPVTSGGAGAPAGSGVNGANNKGLPATGLGCGGGGGSWWGALEVLENLAVVAVVLVAISVWGPSTGPEAMADREWL